MRSIICEKVVFKSGLNLLGNIVQVLEAFQNGLENTVCFLTEGVSAQQLEQLASLMDQKKVDCLTL